MDSQMVSGGGQRMVEKRMPGTVGLHYVKKVKVELCYR